MYYAMPDHLILPLESSAALAAGAAFYRTMIGSRSTMDVGVGVQEVLSLKRWRCASLKSTTILGRRGFAAN